MTFLHMHHAMANKALELVGAEASTTEQFWRPDKTKLREIIMSGAVDYKSRWGAVRVTPDDRKLVLSYMGV